jgi:hypothetical protein
MFICTLCLQPVRIQRKGSFFYEKLRKNERKYQKFREDVPPMPTISSKERIISTANINEEERI